MFKPDYRNVADAANNKEAKRVPLYEHGISVDFMERLTGERFLRHLVSDAPDYEKFFVKYNDFFKTYGYDTVTFEACVAGVLPHGGALAHPRPGYIDCADKFDKYPFDDVADIYFSRFDGMFAALDKTMPYGMRAIGGVGNGLFEIVQDLTGYQNLCLLSYDEPEVYAGLFERTGDMLYAIWERFLDKYAGTFCVLRFGDDLGYRSNTLLPHEDIIKHVVPQYKRIIDLIHSYGKPFLLHSCGNIFDIFPDLIAAGIDAKHSNEDQIAPFTEWVDRYGDEIGNFGGIDTDHLVRMDDELLKKTVAGVFNYSACGHGGFALGSGNSIPDYINPKKYLIMIDTARRLRGE